MKRLRRLLLCIIIALAVFATAFLTWVYLSQDRMIYHPEKYMKADYVTVPPRTVKLPVQTSAGTQFAWYTPPRSTSPEAIPQTLWILFNGNASLALFWSDAIKRAPDPDAGFLVFDYPSYGDSEGNPSLATISETADGALTALATHLHTDVKTLTSSHLRLLGYSLGAAVALDFANRHPAERIILAAPFTTMRAMADRIVNPYLSWLLAHRFDNLKSLEILSRQSYPPRIVITHGIPDPAIPIDMSRELKRRWPDLIELVENPHANHTSILDNIENFLTDDLPKPIGTLDELISRERARQQAAITTSTQASSDH